MTTYKFVCSWPVDTTAARDRMACSLHFDHTVGEPILATDLDAICADIVDVWKRPMGVFNGEHRVDVYKLPYPTGPPVHTHVQGASVWTLQGPGELALCLSFARDRHNKRQRGRIYCPISIWPSVGYSSGRPGSTVMNDVMSLYSQSNSSWPDIGGVDWRFGIYSKRNAAFYQAEYAWVDDEWDTQRRRGRRPTTRLESTREG